MRGFVGWAKRSVPTIVARIGRLVGTAQRRLCPPYDLRPLRRRERLRRIDIEEGAMALDRDFRYRLAVLGDQVAGADIAVKRHQLVEETSRPQYRIAAPSVADGYRDQVAAIWRKGIDQPIDQMRRDQRHVAKTDHRAVGIIRHRRDAGLDRAG